MPLLPLHPADSISTALVAVALIIVVTQLLGALLERLAQPRVIGEILGGILLGPSSTCWPRSAWPCSCS